MARLVELIALPHDPTLPAMARAPAEARNEGAARCLARVAVLRAKLAQARPDVLVIVGSDHLNQFFLDNMPPFLIGKASRLQGPFHDETASWGLERYDVPIAGQLARHLLHDGYRREIDFAYSDEFTVDHSFTIPLSFLRPEQDLPIVPVFLNLLAPPLPPGRRYFRVGQVLRAGIESFPEDLRVAVIATGHLTNAVGSPFMLDCMKTPATPWDLATWDAICRNDLAGLIAHSNWDNLYPLGNGTPGFLGFLCALGIADGAAMASSELVASTFHPPAAFMEWDEATLRRTGRQG